MEQLDHHLTDAELLLAIDGELPPPRQRDADSHLVRCAACRTRQTVIEETLTDAVAVNRPDTSSLDRADRRSRARLEQAMDRASSSALFPDLRWILAGGFAIVALFVLLQWPVIRNVAPPSTGDDRLDDALPSAALTPGATWNVAAADLCAGMRLPGTIAASVRQQVLRGYEMENVPEDQYELDYLITPELGGSPDPRNLWPQRYRSRRWNAHVKDELEELLPRLVCGGKIDLATAQRDIAANWVAAYRKYFKTSEPLETHASVEDDDHPTPAVSRGVETTRGMLWFNRGHSRSGFSVRSASYLSVRSASRRIGCRQAPRAWRSALSVFLDGS